MSHRKQPVRQARVNPPRTATGARALGSHAPATRSSPDEPPGFFPGITHFTDSITALPREMVRQFTMLKEVDAKICRPEVTLKRLVAELLAKPLVPRPSAPPYTVPLATVANRAPVTDNAPSDAPSEEPVYDSQRRELSLQLRMVLNNMNQTMDEKTHVMSAATDTLQKLLARCDSAWPQIEAEIGEVTRLGDPNHRALDNEAAPEKKPSAVGDRPRREAAMGHAHAALAEEREHLRAGGSRKNRAQQLDSDFDEPRPKAKTKSRKHELAAGGSTGLGIVNGTGPNKRRKVEKTGHAATSHVLERGAGSLQSTSRQIGARSPSHTHNAETGKKRSRGNAMAGAISGRKRAGTANSTAHSPAMASSPVMGNFPVSSRGGHSPAMGAAMQRTSSTRARQNSQTSAPARQASTSRPDGGAGAHLVEPTSHPKSGDIKTFKTEDGAAVNTSTTTDNGRSARSTERSSGPKKDDAAAKHRPPSISTASRPNGRASKTGTPVAAGFPEAAPRPRSGRTVHAPAAFGAEAAPAAAAAPKRSHKKGAGLAAQQQKAAAAEAALSRAAAATVTDEGGSAAEDDEEGADEPTYCYCGGVSYGAMVACDGPRCSREWFHLDCAGLSKAPKDNEKWFCRDCQPKAQKIR